MNRAVRRRALGRAAVLAVALALPLTLDGQFTNRYPKVPGFAHHIYLEGYELPVLNVGPSDPAPSPDGETVALAARGWLWLLDLASGEARRLTRGPDLDSRPAWSPDGRRLVFVRDGGRDTAIVELDLDRDEERVLVDTPALDLDPAYGAVGRTLFYSSASAGDLDLWRLDLDTAARTRITDDVGLELRAQPVPDGRRLVYLTKQRRGTDGVTLFDLDTGNRRVLWEDWSASQTRPALSRDGRRMALGVPGPERWHLEIHDLAGGPSARVARSSRLPLMPAWDAAGESVYFVEADEHQVFQLWQVDVSGDAAEIVSPAAWRWGDRPGRLVVTTRHPDSPRPVPARLHVADASGHPALPDTGQPRFDSQSGLVYVYSPGRISLEVPAGEVRVTAARGLGAPAVGTVVTVRPGETAEVAIELDALWDPSSEGWYSGDHHFHLNYGGPYRLVPDDLVPIMEAEDLDLGTPLLANLHMRLSDTEWWGWTRTGAGPPFIHFGQEVRSHFLGHVGLIGIASLHWPWFWGPGYSVYGQDDRPNRSPLAHARQEGGGVAAYVHPVSIRDPFPSEGPPRGIPLELVPDAVLGDLDMLEVACLWSDELGTSEIWYRLLDLGLPIAPSAGTDAFPDFYRSMAVGTTRVYARVDEPLWVAGHVRQDAYLESLRAGRSFVTTGPLLKFEVNGVEAGGAIAAGPEREVPWGLTLYSPSPVDHVEVVVNGEVVWSGEAIQPARERRYTGRVAVPPGGWIAARAHGGPTEWPAMDSYPFAHTAPIWVGAVGSRDPVAAASSARDLLRWLDVAEPRLIDGYGDVPIPKLRQRFRDARRALETIAAGVP